jgi:hopene-associated glycosyltransferase HpnB
MTGLVFLASLIWLLILLLPIRVTGTRERLEADHTAYADLSDVTVLIPARDEAHTILRTLNALNDQGRGLAIVVVDDQSSDDTAKLAAGHPLGPTVISGHPLPERWVGKVWALEQGYRQIHTPFVLLLDADIELAPGMVAALRDFASKDERAMVSVLARLCIDSFWERLLVPAYVYFFKLLYPFALVNDSRFPLGGAAGGCMLLRCDALRDIGGFHALRAAIIDDCSLASLIKGGQRRIWLGLTDSAISHRPYPALRDVWNLVTRSGFAQLRFSATLLLLCTGTMLGLFLAAPIGVVMLDGPARLAAWVGSLAMLGTYLPVLYFYRLTPWRAVTLPFVALAFLAMTWHSALRYWRGTRTVWKSRRYMRARSEPR